MLDAPPEVLERRARRLAEGAAASSRTAVARARGGALPLLELDGPAVALDPGRGADALAARCATATRRSSAASRAGRVMLDPRTLADDELDAAIAAVRAARRP